MFFAGVERGSEREHWSGNDGIIVVALFTLWRLRYAARSTWPSSKIRPADKPIARLPRTRHLHCKSLFMAATYVSIL